MWFLLTSVALAGPPYHACDVDSSGKLAVLSPKDGALSVLEGDTLATVATVERTGDRWNHVLLANPSGGWWTGTSPVMEVSADGRVARASDPQPAAFWDALKGGSTADSKRGVSLLVTRDDKGGVVFRNEEGASQTQLWDFEGWANEPLVLHQVGATIYAVGHGKIEQRTDKGVLTGDLPLPDRDTIGLCGGASGVPLTAITFGSRREACVNQWVGGVWKQLTCTSPL